MGAVMVAQCEKVESFLEGLARLRVTCEGVIGFDEESEGEDMVNDTNFSDKIESDNTDVELRCKQFLKKIRDDNHKAGINEEQAKSSQRLETMIKIIESNFKLT